MNRAHLTRLLFCTLAAASLAVSLTLAVSGGMSGVAWAGGTGLDDRDEDDAGTPFFGLAKDLDANSKAMPDTKVVAEVKGGNASLVTRTDAQGHYKISGFGKDVDPNTIEITCSKEGYKLQRAARRRLSNDPGSPVEVDCLMVKQ